MSEKLSTTIKSTKLKDIKIGADGDKPETMGILSRNKNMEYFQAKPEKKEPEERVKLGLLISRADCPKKVYYDGEEMRLSPRARAKIANIDKVGIDEKGKRQPLPQHVILVPIKK